MNLPGGKVISGKMAAAIAGGAVAVAGVAIGAILILGGEKSFRNISVLEAIGKVQVKREDISDVIDAYENMNLIAGDNVSVGETSELDLKLDEDKYVYVEENTQMWLEADGTAENSKTIIHLSDGAVLNRLDNKLSSESIYEVDTPNSTMSIRGTVVLVKVYTDENGIVHTDYAVPEGTVVVTLHSTNGEDQNKTVVIEAGMQCKTIGGDEFSEVVLQDVEGVMSETAPIDLRELSDTSQKNLARIVKTGRVLKSGKNVLSADDVHVFIAEDEPEQEDESEGEPVITLEVTGEVIPTPTVTPQLTPIVKAANPTPIASSAKPTPVVTVMAKAPGTPDEGSGDGNPEVTPTSDPAPTPAAVYVVKFVLSDGTLFGTQLVEGGGTVALPQLKPTTQGSWCLAGDQDYVAFNFGTAVNSDLVLTWR